MRCVSLLCALSALCLGASRARGGDFQDGQERVRAQIGADRPWRALSLAGALAARPGLSAAQRVWVLRETAGLRAAVGDSLGAERDLRGALEVQPDDPAARLALARLLRDERPEEALRQAERAEADATTASARAAAQLLAGELRLDLGDAPGARSALARALRSSGEGLDALAASALAWREDARRAAEYAARAERRARTAPLWYRGAALRFCGRLWDELGDDDRAAGSFRGALAVDPDDADALDALLAIEEKRGPAPLVLARPALLSEPPTIDDAVPVSGRPEADDDLETLRRGVETARARGDVPEAVALADRFVEAAAGAPAWRRPDAYRSLSEALLGLGPVPAVLDRVYGCAQRSAGLGLTPSALFRMGMRLMRAERPRAGYQYWSETNDEWAILKGGADDLGARLEQAATKAYLHAFLARGRLADLSGARATLERWADALSELREAEQARARSSAKDGGPAKSGADAAAEEERLRAQTRARVEDLLRRARAQRAQGDAAGAESRLEGALSLAPDHPEALAEMSELLAAREPRRALPYLERLLQVSREAEPSRRVALYRGLAQLQSALGDQAGAEARLKEALAVLPDDRSTLRELVGVEKRRGEPRLARDYADRLRSVLDRALDRAPDGWSALRERTALELEEGNPGRAIALLESRRRRVAAGSQAAWLAWHGLARAARGEGPAARRELEQAAASDPESVCRGDGLPAERDRYPIAYFDVCLERFPEDARLYADRGVAWFLAGLSEQALEDFRNAVRLDPGSAQAQLSLVTALASERRVDEALAAADRALPALDRRQDAAYEQLLALRRRLSRARR